MGERCAAKRGSARDQNKRHNQIESDLGVRVDVHFDDAVVDGVFDVGHIAAAAAVEDKLDRQRPSREA